MYEIGFVAKGPEPYMTENWLFQKEKSNKRKLVFYGYDANMYPITNLSKRPKSKWNQKIIDEALEFTKNFEGEVWLDDVCIKKD